jgi:hypothetical protein
MAADSLIKRAYEADLTRSAFALYLLPWMTLTAKRPIGTNIFDREWDALIVLDACRVDAMREVADEYEFVEDVGTVTSVGSSSKEWFSNTYRRKYIDEIANTTLLSANGWPYRVFGDVDFSYWTATKGSFLESHPIFGRLMSREVVSREDFDHFELLQYLADRQVYDNPSPADVTDRAITVGRENDSERFVVHYMQPHAPYISRAVETGRIEDWERDPFAALRSGKDPDVVWDAYLDNLRCVLDSVDVLLKNLDADRVVITADHGELFGEWGLYGHISGILHPSLKRVPWVETTAEDTQSYEPQLTSPRGEARETEDEAVTQRLADLGYM